MAIDNEVIGLVQAGRREAAVTQILTAYRRKVFGLAYSFLRSREAAQDVAQEVFIRIWRALPAFDGRASLSTWVYTITRNTSLTALRARRDHTSLTDVETQAEAELIDESASAETSAVHAQLVRLVAHLPERQRQVVTLFYMEEQSHEEVAAMLAMPVGTVKTLLHRARAKLSEAAGVTQDD